jgi:rSAM/selenodomain-associated transferase 1
MPSAASAVIVFARAPVAGAVKTRLIPRLGAPGAARLQQRLTRCALRMARGAHCGPVELHLTRPHALYRGAKRQKGDDLGERMQNALALALRRYRSAILIGTDAPALTAADLRRAARWLQGGADVVLAPAEDGGYALIAATRVSSSLFRGMPWGSDRVYAETVKRANQAGLRWRALRTVWDVDRPADLERLRSLRFSSASRRCARR